MKKTFNFSRLILVLAFITIPVVSFAEDNGNHAGGGNNGNGIGNGGGSTGGGATAPIDGGLSLLVAAGISYGVKKVASKRKEDLTIVK